MNTTEWFPAEIKPVHVGVYETEDSVFTDDAWYSYWNGEKWGWYSWKGVDDAYAKRDWDTGAPDARWRGLRESA
jgi:hypothetical protein